MECDNKDDMKTADNTKQDIQTSTRYIERPTVKTPLFNKVHARTDWRTDSTELHKKAH